MVELMLVLALIMAAICFVYIICRADKSMIGDLVVDLTGGEDPIVRIEADVPLSKVRNMSFVTLKVKLLYDKSQN